MWLGDHAQMRASHWLLVILKAKVFRHLQVISINLLQFEAIPESLKNMLLVMSTAGIFDEEECTLTSHSQTDSQRTHKRSDSEVHKYSALWQVTWERIDCFLPNMRQELFTPRSQSTKNSESHVKAEEPAVTDELPDDACQASEGKVVLYEVQAPFFCNLTQ